MSGQDARRLAGRAVLALLTLYALAMIVPDFVRIVRPLGSFGLATNADGLVYDVQGPFADEAESPAWRAGSEGRRPARPRRDALPSLRHPCAARATSPSGAA